MTVSNKVYSLTHSQKTLTAAFAASPTSSPGYLAKTLYAEHHKKPISSGGYLETFMGVLQHGSASETQRIPSGEPTQADLDRAAECGNFGSRPSDLFLKIYCDVLATLDTNPWAGVVSPPLLGSRGVVNLSIISVIPDIIQHHYDCIVRAESEVFLATNFWQASKSASKICDALLELSRRATKRGKKVVVKMMYDRANLKMLTESHIIVDDAEMASDEVKLPKRSDMPGIDFELVNFHQPVFGTFHCKFMIVDRKMALLNSNNIQDRPNMEMMIHLEGPIVDSLYDTALVSWFRPMHPPLPLLNTGYRPPKGGYKFGMNNEYATTWILDGSKGAELFKTLQQEAGGIHDETGIKEERKILPLLDLQMQGIPYEPPASSRDEYTPHILHTRHGECPMVLVNRAPNGSPGNPAIPVVEGILNAVRRGIECTLYIDVGFNDGGEALPGQGGTNEEVSKTMFAQLTDEEKEKLKLYWYTGKDQIKPVNASAQKRNCHVKLMTIDDSVGIVGNGNQDTQSWYHSQEVNVMVDNPTVCQEWFDGVRRNQNTHLHEVEKDGIYRDKDGNPLTDSTGVGSGFRGVVKGIQGSIARVRGKGGF
ncbi:uncharacterized protein BJ212DRAFT_1345885 [Suillus subaureus]|uniref:PLD phosphodiesterase domain-containing protein n=1 Tax=Suillus subaureus TaxID=48587 RepID=A0A9P7JEX5_9AGAM|nr:uncharacterized protein BJ212DRAFT_1345885 [Suillus subaureus]KAG1818492.1 hypothetical protein BJ212DRAFT_1345885 [Suillus subaureus]